MGVTADDCLAHLRLVEAGRREEGRRRAAGARRGLPEAARLLRERYGARRVLVFGSLVAGLPHAASDVDIAVEGLRLEDYFAALADLMDVFGGPVDLVRLEDAPTSLRDRIAAEAEAL